jgi:hypothetical protein
MKRGTSRNPREDVKKKVGWWWRWVALLLLKMTMPDVMPPTTAQAGAGGLL